MLKIFCFKEGQCKIQNTQYFGEKGRNYEGEPDFICLCFSSLHSLPIDYMLYLLLYI